MPVTSHCFELGVRSIQTRDDGFVVKVLNSGIRRGFFLGDPLEVLDHKSELG